MSLSTAGLAAALLVTIGDWGHRGTGDEPTSVQLKTSTNAANSTAVPAFAHVVIVVMENTSASSIIGNTTQATYVNGLAAQYAYSSNYFAVTHPSLPNYLALTGASTFGITSDCSPASCPVNAINVMDRIEAAGLTWKAYMESMPASCGTTDAYPYAVKHNPFVYYNNVRTNAGRCQSHVVPFTQLACDFRSASTTPAYSFITPNMCNDMHDCSIATGDAWLSRQIPAILSSPAFTQQNSVLFLTWDEDDSSGNNRVDLVVAGPQIRRAYVSGSPYNHYSIHTTLEAAWNLAALTSNDSTGIAMADLSSPALNPSLACSGVTLTSSSPSQATGGSVTFSAATSGCPNPVYRFWIQPPGGAWSIKQDYSSAATFAWSGTGHAGSYGVEVDVRDASENVSYDAVKNVTYQLNGCSAASLGASPASPQYPSGSVLLAATATCPGTPTYKFCWPITGLALGSYGLEVDVRDQGGTDSYEKVNNITYILTATPCATAGLTASPPSPGATGGTITFTANTSGCTNPVYRFWIKAPGANWGIVQHYTTNNTFLWQQPATGMAGSYGFEVDVRDQAETTSYDVVKNITYQLNGCSAAGLS